jgi:hypothetical protein
VRTKKNALRTKNQEEEGDDVFKTEDKPEIAQKMKPIERVGKRVGVYVKTKHAHKGWITKIKYY